MNLIYLFALSFVFGLDTQERETFFCPSSSFSSLDSDRDGLSDSLEDCLTCKGAPLLVFSKYERCGTHFPLLVQVRPYASSKDSRRSFVIATYVLLFKKDCGIHFGGFNQHSGDSESFRVVFERDARTNRGSLWSLFLVKYSHHHTSHVITANKEKIRLPIPVYLSLGKHGLYPDRETCAQGGFWGLDRCFSGGPVIATGQDRYVYNVGEPDTVRYFEDLSLFGLSQEKVFDRESRFCGGLPQTPKTPLNWFYDFPQCGGPIAGKWIETDDILDWVDEHI